MKKKKEIKAIRFINKKGAIMTLPDNLTLNQLTIMGFQVRVVDPGAPLKKHEWRSVDESDR